MQLQLIISSSRRDLGESSALLDSSDAVDDEGDVEIGGCLLNRMR